MKNLFVAVVIIIVVSGCFAALGRYDQKEAEKLEEQVGTRFELVKEINFDVKYRSVQKAKIYKDKETGIKYIYMWCGGYRGGPVMTRLWEE